MRAAGQAYFTGMIDDVAVWNRALTAAEVADLYAQGTPVPPPVTQPLAIHKFSADLAAVAQGDPVTLRWDISKDADKVEIQPEIGDVTARTAAGAGSVQVTLQTSVSYTLTARRGNEVLTQSLSVAAISGVAPGWALLDNFDRYPVGNLPAPWAAPGGASVVDVNGNRMLSVGVNQALCALPLTTLSVPEGQRTTLFARFYLPDAVDASGIDEIMGLTDKGLRFLSDELGDFGPGIRMQNPNGDPQIGTENGNGNPLEFATMTFQPKTVYNLWIDITNDTVANGDLVSIYAAKDGGASRTTLFSGYRSNRNPNDASILGPTRPDLIYLIVGANTATSTVYFDDFYLSKSGYNGTVPHAFGFTQAVVPSAPVSLSAVLSGNNVVISWPKNAGTGYTLEWASSVNGIWSALGVTAVDAGANSTVTVPTSESMRFFRLQK
jgi:hypothetical protein